MVVVAVLIGLMVPAVNQVLQGNRMEEAGRMIVDEIQLARQIAAARNLMVELRFVERSVDGSPANMAFRGLQSGVFNKTNSSEFIPLTRMALLPDGVIMSTNAQLSSILGALAKTTSSQFGYQYVSIAIRPTGMLEPQTGLALNQPWFVTAIPRSQSGKTIEEIDNFATVQVDPWTARPTLFRP